MWRRTALYSVLFMMGADMFLAPMLIPAMADEFGAQIPHTALIVAAFGASYAISSPLLTGLLSSRSSWAVIGGGLPIVVLACVVAAHSHDLAMLTAARAASGLGAAIVNPAVWSQLNTTAPQNVGAKAMLGGTAASAAGQVVAIPLGAILSVAIGWRVVFLALAVGFLLVWAATVLAAARENPAVKETISPGAVRGILDGLRLWQLPIFSCTVAGNITAQAARLGTFAYASAQFSSWYGITGARLGIIGIVAGAGSLAGAVVATTTVARWRRRGWPVLGFILTSVAVMFVGIALMTAPISAPLSLIGLGLNFAAGTITFGAGQFFLSTIFPGNRTAMSWNSSAMYIGAAVGTFTLGITDLAPGPFMVISLAFVVISALSFSATMVLSRHSPAIADTPPDTSMAAR
ncbi:putative MFS family arabinose efflux permease [Mycobacterium sp. MAA66]